MDIKSFFRFYCEENRPFDALEKRMRLHKTKYNIRYKYGGVSGKWVTIMVRQFELTEEQRAMRDYMTKQELTRFCENAFSGELPPWKLSIKAFPYKQNKDKAPDKPLF